MGFAAAATRLSYCLALSLLAAVLGARAQEAESRIYPAPAPTAADLAHAIPDRQQFANPSVLGMGPSKGLIVCYERMPCFGLASTADVVGPSNYSAEATKNVRLAIKGYIPV